MPEFLKNISKHLAEFWKGLDKSQKIRLYITSAITVITVITAIFFLTKPNRVILINNADQKQIGEMSSILNDNKIWNQIENNGTSLLIDSKNNNKAQVVLAQEGYPKDGMTFEDAINLIGISTTESDKKHIWEKQQVSDIEAKLKLLDNIESAAVTLALPEQTIFASEGQEKPKPTATVVVKLKDSLTQEQVKGIVAIVSKSVEGLDPKDVSVVDTNANILNSDTSDDSVLAASNQEEMRKKREEDLQNKVAKYFSGGQYDNFDTFRVVVNAVLDFDMQKSQSKTLTNPNSSDTGAVLNSDITKETATDGGASGVAGTGSNPGTDSTTTYATGTNGNGTYSRTQEVKNFGYNETVTDTQKATGKLIPDESSMAVQLCYGKTVTTDKGLTDAFITQVKQAASTATGIPIKNISVYKYKLAQPEVAQKSVSDQIKQLVTDYGFFAIMLILIISMLMAIRPKKRRITEEMPQLAAAAAGIGSAAGPRFVVPDPGEPIPEIELEERSEIKKQIDKFVKQKPDAVAQLLRNWLSDEWDV